MLFTDEFFSGIMKISEEIYYTLSVAVSVSFCMFPPVNNISLDPT